MIKHLQKVSALALAGFAFLANTEANAQSLIENFDYAAGTLLTAQGWTGHSGAGTNSITVLGATDGLSYATYKGAGVGSAVALTTSGEDVSKTFATTGINSGSVYAGVLVNVSAAQADGDYFFHLGPSTMGFAFAGRVYIKAGENGGIKFSVSKGSTAPAAENYTANEYDLNTTHLLVIKYTFNSANNNDDVVEMFVNPDMSLQEPTTASITATDNVTANDYTDIGTVALRQGSGSKAATLKADGIVVGTSWSALQATTTGIADATKGMFSIYPNPMQNQNVRLSLPGHVGSQKVNLTVWSVEGKALIQASGSQAQVQATLNDKMAALPKGMFFVNVTAGSEIYQTKLLKN